MQDVIVQHYEKCFEEYGDSYKGVDWPNEQDALTRYGVMLDVVKQKPASILDFGCGLGHLYQYILNNKINVIYYGYDLSQTFVNVCKNKFTTIPFYSCNPLSADYVIANGVFTEKCTLGYESMVSHFSKTVKKAFDLARIGLAFNVMSTHVDWERDDLFHVSMDWMADFVIKVLGTRNFVMRNDYGLYEYTTYVYR